MEFIPTKTTATLIRKTALSDTSLIVHWCSAEAGIVKTVAKGARRAKSPFAGKLDLFYHCEIEIHRAKPGNELHILKDVAVLQNRLGIRGSYGQTLGASYFVKLVELVAEHETELPEIADLLNRGLDFLSEDGQQPDRRAVRHFEKQLAGFLGISEPGVEAAASIESTFGRLPKQRLELATRWES
ncbi:MAG: hypothetical protein HKN23_02060 [Verrucomicrobiales bacterium]|nr:hypothetical protein [Verrucomicrobiales bacterium]